MIYRELEKFVREILKEAKENNFFEVFELVSTVFKKGYERGFEKGYERGFDDGFDYALEVLK